ncbi:MAG: PEGA domain-containing protein [Archangium sp.]|nr:PEGA domain-containing protein [Archangium sp.]
MSRLVGLAITLLSSLALAAPYRQTSGGGCCTLVFVIIFVAIYRSGGVDWARAVGAAIFPGVFGWFIWRDRELGTGSRWFALITASLHAFFFLAGVVLALAVSAGAFNALAIPGVSGEEKPPPAIDLSKIPEDESLGLHPLSTITSDPPGAKVFVGGKERGKTPLETPLTAGENNEVKLELAGFFPATQTRMPNARENLTLTFTLKAASRLEVKSEPPGARVMVGMKEVLPRTPGLSAPIDPGETEILVLLDGYQPHRQTMALPAGDTELEVTLSPGVKLAVGSTPEQAEIYVDGLWVGLTPASVFVEPKGKHVVELKKEPYATAKKVFASVAKPTAWSPRLVDTARVKVQAIVNKARARYDKVNQALEKVQTRISHMSAPPPALERQLANLEREMEKAAIALEKAEAELKVIDEERPASRPPAPPDTGPD